MGLSGHKDGVWLEENEGGPSSGRQGWTWGLGQVLWKLSGRFQVLGFSSRGGRAGTEGFWVV